MLKWSERLNPSTSLIVRDFFLTFSLNPLSFSLYFPWPGAGQSRVHSGLTHWFCFGFCWFGVVWVFLHVLSSPTRILDYSSLGKNSVSLLSWPESGAGEAGNAFGLDTQGCFV